VHFLCGERGGAASSSYGHRVPVEAGEGEPGVVLVIQMRLIP
jgi:hypothetical protein